MTVDHLATSALPYGHYITLFIVFVVGFGLAIAFAGRKVAGVLEGTNAPDLRRAAVITPPRLPGTMLVPVNERRY